MGAREVQLIALPGIPLVGRGDDLAAIVLAGYAAAGTEPRPGDVVVVAQKIVSKAEGRAVALATIEPSAEARALARETAKDARVCELILSESTAVLRRRPGLVVVVHRSGVVLANAGIDQSNVAPDGGETALLLPVDPDASAGRLRRQIAARSGADVAVIVSDSLGRAWRMGTIGTALGASGIGALVDLRGRGDLFGRPLQSSQVGLADEIASAAALLQGEAAEGAPVVVVRGLDLARAEGRAADLIRPPAEDLFR